MPTESEKPVYTLRLDPDQDEKIKKIAGKYMTVQSVIRMALDQYLEKTDSTCVTR